jgi:hypothetical protein
MSQPTRRQFNASLLGSLMACGLIESLYRQNLFADTVKPTIAKWLSELVAMTQDLRGAKLKDVEFQAKMEELYRRADLPQLLQAIQFDKLSTATKLPDNGAASIGFDFSKVEGAPAKLGFGKQIFGLKQGRSVVPHGHANMCTGFIVLNGEFEGKHYDRLETHKDHYIIKPTIDNIFKAGGVSTISDHKDNVHWFKCVSGTGFIFNVHVIGYDETIESPSGRLYLDVEGEKLAGGLIKAAKMTSSACHKKFG